MDAETDERILIAKAQGGDPAALEELFCRCKTRLDGLVRARWKAREDVPDILQETFLRAFRTHEALQRSDGSEDSVFRWLAGIAVNVIHEHSRRGKRTRAMPIQDDLEAKDVTASRGLRRRERLERLRQAIECLSPEHREVVTLVRIEGLPVKEAARRLGKTPNAISRMLLRAGRCLKESLGATESLSLPPGGLAGEGGRHGE